MTTELLARADRLREERTPFVLATVVRAERPTSAKAGDRAIVLADGAIEGFVGGVCAESTVRVEGLRLLGAGESTLLRITPADGDPAEADDPEGTELERREGLVVVANPCLSGGTLDIFLEAVLPAALLHVFGDAPVARALATVASAAGYAVRSTTDPALPIAADTAAVVVASHGRDEEKALLAAVDADVPYIGLVASRKRGAAVVADLRLTTERIHTPAGLDIGARTPLQIAVSIVAELIATAPRGGPVRRPRAMLPLLVPATTATDPVCGMSVAAVPASLQAEHAGATWYFCGPGCRQAFLDDPERYGA